MKNIREAKQKKEIEARIGRKEQNEGKHEPRSIAMVDINATKVPVPNTDQRRMARMRALKIQDKTRAIERQVRMWRAIHGGAWRRL